MARFFRDGLGGVLRRVLDAREALPVDYSQVIQPSLEARAIRLWEEFDERVVRWWVQVSQAAVGGEFAGVVIQPNVNMLPGSLWTVEQVIVTNNLGGALFAVGATPGGFASGAVKYCDNRWGPVAAGVGPQLDVSFGSDPATSGFNEWAVPPNVAFGPNEWPGWISTEVGQNFAVWGAAIAQALVVGLAGRIVVPQ